jgi:predicted signal transduction protein with EAL and GGDEF domain
VVIELVARVMHASAHVFLDTGLVILFLGMGCAFIALKNLNLKSLVISLLEKRNKNVEGMLSSIIEDNFDGIIIVNTQFQPLVMSRMARRMLEVEDAQPNIQELLPQNMVDDIQKSLSGGVETTMQGATKEVLLELNALTSKNLEYTLTPSEVWDEDTHSNKRVVYVYFKDITAKKAAEQQVIHLANHHPISDLPNRVAMRTYLANVMADDEYSELCVITFSIQNLDELTAASGYETTKALLKAFASRFRKQAWNAECIANFGENRFTMVMRGRDSAEDQAVELLISLAEAYSIGGTRVLVDLYCGVSCVDSSEDQVDDETLLNQSITALQKAKEENLSYPCWFEKEQETEIQLRRELELELIQAIERGELKVAYQPQFDIKTGRLVGAEALLRWISETRGFVSPEVFIPIAEKSDLITQIGDWVCERVAQDMSKWPKHLTIAINASAAQFIDGDFHTKLETLVEKYKLLPSQIDIEITESLFIGDPEAVIAQLMQIRECGFGVALDDFGTGYSSLSYIQNFPLDKIKIDQSFTFTSHENDKSRTIIEMVAYLAKGFGMKTVLEGIETDQHWAIGKEIGATVGQGYLYSKPLFFPEMEKFIETEMELVAD